MASTRSRVLILGLCLMIGVGSGLALVNLASTSTVPGLFTHTGHMVHGRTDPTALLLADGRVVIMGGDSSGPVGTWAMSVEVYDPTTGMFRSATPLDGTGGVLTATLLPDGRVLVIGRDKLAPELFDPRSGTPSTTSPMASARNLQAAVALNDGRVLVMGGEDQNLHLLQSAEIYDPTTGEFSLAGSMNAPRAGLTATLLHDGRVLVVGGNDSASAEVYDPGSARFAPIASSTTPHDVRGAVSLPDGKVLVIGNSGSAYLFDPATDTFVEKGSPTKYDGACFAPLPDGRVLFAGGGELHSRWGLSSYEVPQASVQIYDPETGRSLPTASMGHAREACTAVALGNGRVLVMGGDEVATLGSAELFQLR
jgi:hypothetical protein